MRGPPQSTGVPSPHTRPMTGRPPHTLPEPRFPPSPGAPSPRFTTCMAAVAAPTAAERQARSRRFPLPPSALTPPRRRSAPPLRLRLRETSYLRAPPLSVPPSPTATASAQPFAISGDSSCPSSPPSSRLLPGNPTPPGRPCRLPTSKMAAQPASPWRDRKGRFVPAAQRGVRIPRRDKPPSSCHERCNHNNGNYNCSKARSGRNIYRDLTKERRPRSPLCALPPH